MEDEDEYSWPRRTIPRRHSMEDHHHRRSSNRLVINNHRDEDDQALDFHDVFGGPPCSIMPSGHSSGDFGITTSSSTSSNRSTKAFYNDIFCHTTHHHSDRHRGASERRGGNFQNDSRRMRSNNNSIGRNLPGFNIPLSSSSSPSYSASMPVVPERSSSSVLKKAGLFTEVGFYDDIFGSEHGSFGRRGGKPRICHNCKTKLISKSKSKTSGSSAASILRSEDIQSHSYLRSNINDDMLPAVAHHNTHGEDEDAVLSSFTSKLRPITIPTRTTHYESSSPPSTSSGSDGESGGGHGWTPKINLELSSFIDLPSSSDIKSSLSYINTDSFQQYNYTKPSCGDGDHHQHLVNDSYSVSKDFSATVSPSSVTSSVFLEPLLERNTQVGNTIMEKVVVVQEDEGNKAGDESSFIIDIDINSHCVKGKGETEGAAALDEAIAWAKETFWNKQLASDTTRSVGMKNDETIDFCNSSKDANG